MRAWLLTNTLYGTWLPGDRRGSVTSVRDLRPDDPPAVVRFEHDLPGEPYEEALPGLERSARAQMKGPPLFLDRAQAEILLGQFQETAACRAWELHAAAVMFNHWHLVVVAPGDPDPGRMLADFKAYGTRVLNRLYGKPLSDYMVDRQGVQAQIQGRRRAGRRDPLRPVQATPPAGGLVAGAGPACLTGDSVASRERQRPEFLRKTPGARLDSNRTSLAPWVLPESILLNRRWRGRSCHFS